jgi:predicted nicotinamide N-methyase
MNAFVSASDYQRELCRPPSSFLQPVFPVLTGLPQRSLHLMHHLLTQHHYPPPSPKLPLLDPGTLSKTRILELGSGTGSVATLLSPLVRDFTASDQFDNLALVKRNLELNGVKVVHGSKGDSVDGVEVAEDRHKDKTKKQSQSQSKDKLAGGSRYQTPHPDFESIGELLRVRLEEIDWVSVSRDRQTRRSKSISARSLTPHELPDTDRYDLILAIDCIYNENLIQPLVDTFSYYTSSSGKTLVWVICELRSSEVVSGPPSLDEFR